MLRKLLKYEFRSLSKILVPLMIGMLGLAVVTSLVYNLKNQLIDTSDYTNNMYFLSIAFTGIIVLVSALAIAAFLIVTLILLLYRFYQNLFTDEGYLSHTLPVTASEHLNAKLIAASIWAFLCGLVTIAGVFMFILVGTAPKGSFINIDVIDSLRNLFDSILHLIDTGTWLTVLQTILSVIISIPASFLIFYLAITMGAIIAKKHKILMAVGLYVGISIGLAIINMIFNIIFMMITVNISNDSSLAIINLNMLQGIIVNLGTGITCYLICRSLIMKKLNLS